ncbi:MAG TPA: ATP-binding cassette domain-containing protein [Methylomusa anaerophila]|uniref:Putative D,D-dipeptide transport ATP-binding protein DdpF n=1 Tax=Methylomusa anaerophila TaxID=1930071 RepID=A0A348AEC8_9FIRM|nr:ATP-binding cassette domain-containing protein [Methylomusa anaerophila]BBB89426.1 putative D,D-dipeptide transport ATP-binding protein DdpF [Methylomusa anaerophila]HML89660.1 ATP-binding cassette domain-containing protein [Methylomusa anaerophila]
MPLEGQDLYYRYGNGPWVLAGVNIAIKSGEVVGLIGSSGYGKTTLGRILAGYEQPHRGTVKLNGSLLPRRGYNPVQLVFQHPEKAINPRWRMQDTLYEGERPDAAIVQSLGIQQAWLKRWPNELSGGELQRFCVARALTQKTRFLIADEMTTMLDAVTQAQIWHVVLYFARKYDMGVLVVSHEKNLIQRICSRVVHLADLNSKQPGRISCISV